MAAENFRQFEVGPDPFGRMWKVHFRWLQTGISIRHADTVDVKFGVSVDNEPFEEKVIALDNPSLIRLTDDGKAPLTDGLCMKLAAKHLKKMIETGEDIEKAVAMPQTDELFAYFKSL